MLKSFDTFLIISKKRWVKVFPDFPCQHLFIQVNVFLCLYLYFVVSQQLLYAIYIHRGFFSSHSKPEILKSRNKPCWNQKIIKRERTKYMFCIYLGQLKRPAKNRDDFRFSLHILSENFKTLNGFQLIKSQSLMLSYMRQGRGHRPFC